MKASDVKLWDRVVERVEKAGYQIDIEAPSDMVVEYKIYYKFIFDHDFAKALWGDAFLDNNGEEMTVKLKKGKVFLDMSGKQPAYLYHLIRMVQTKEPLEYIKKNL